LLQAGAEMAENIASDPGKALAAAQKWRGLVGQE
jgi:hypothetical protein